MSKEMTEGAIVAAVAEAAATRVCRRTIRALRAMEATLSSEGSELENVWNEVCVQVQYEPSVVWEVYEQTVEAIIEGFLLDIPGYEKSALWLQTDSGIEWLISEDDDISVTSIIDNDIRDYIASEYVYREAGACSNKQIRAYLDRLTMMD